MLSTEWWPVNARVLQDGQSGNLRYLSLALHPLNADQWFKVEAREQRGERYVCSE